MSLVRRLFLLRSVGFHVSRRTIFIVAAVLVLGVAVLGLPLFVKQIAERKLPAYLAASGLEASWEKMGMGWGDRVTLEKVELRETAHDVSVTVEQLVVRIALRSLFSETPQIQGVQLEGVVVEVDLASLSAPADASGGVQQPDSAGVSSGGRLRRVLEHLPDIALSDVALHVQNEGETLAVVGAREISLEAVDQLWRLEARGGVRFGESVSALEIEGRMVGTLDPFGRSLEAEITHEESEKALIDWQMAGLGGLQLQTVRVDLGMSRASSVALEGLRVHLAAADKAEDDAEAMLLEALVPSARVVYSDAPDQAGNRLHVRARNPHLAVRAESAAKIRRSLSRMAGMIRGAEDAEAGAAGGEGSGQVSAAGKVAALLWLASVDVQGATAEILGAAEKVTFAESLAMAVRRGRVVARGHVLGGDVFVDASFAPGEKIPQAARLQMRGVELSMLPGTTRGLGQPIRGIRGSVGGKIDMNLLVSAPHLGPKTAVSRAPVFVSGSVDLREGMLDIAGLSAEPLTDVAFGTDFHATWNQAAGRLAVTESVLRSGPVAAQFDARIDGWPTRPVAQLDARIEEGPCQDLVRAIPRQLLGPYRRVVVEGDVAPGLRLRIPLDQPRLLTFKLTGFEELPCAVTALNAERSAWPDVRFADMKPPPPPTPQKWGLFGDIFGIGDMPKTPVAIVPADLEPPTGEHRRKILADVDWLNYPFIKQVTEGVSQDEEGVLADIKVGPGLPTYVPISELPPYVGAAMYLTEEMMFYTNRGVSFSLMQKAIRINLDKNRYVYGGSTVTQQLVKNLFLTRHKTLDRKLQEAFIAWRIDEAVSKDRVLELYVNVIEFGPDVYGIHAAAQYYFQKDARQLTPLESVFLATLKPSPWVGARYMRRKKTPESGWWGNRMEEIFDRLVERNYLTREQADAERPYVVVWE